MDQATARNSFFRPVILFSAAYLIIGIIHEAAHAVTAYALDVPFTMFHFAVDVARDRGSLTDHATIGVAGPLCALIIGLVCWLFYSRSKGSRSELMLLYLATFGVATFFGNLMSAAFVGDFSRAAIALRLPASGKLDVRSLIDHRKNLEQGLEAFELAGKKGALKVLVEVSDL